MFLANLYYGLYFQKNVSENQWDLGNSYCKNFPPVFLNLNKISVDNQTAHILTFKFFKNPESGLKFSDVPSTL